MRVRKRLKIGALVSDFNQSLTDPGQSIRWRPIAFPPCRRDNSHVESKRALGDGCSNVAITDYTNGAASKLAVKWYRPVVVPQRWRKRGTKNSVSFERRIHLAEAGHEFEHCAKANADKLVDYK